MDKMSNKEALRILRECVNIASQQYPGVASDYLVAIKTIEKTIKGAESYERKI